MTSKTHMPPHRTGTQLPLTRPMLWFVTAISVMFDVLLFLEFQAGPTALHGVVLLAAAAVTVCLGLCLIDATRFWWAMRLVTGVVFLAFSYALVSQWLFADPVTEARQRLMAVAAFCVAGVPALVYSLWGNPYGPIDVDNPHDATLGDIISQLLVTITVFSGVVGFATLLFGIISETV